MQWMYQEKRLKCILILLALIEKYSVREMENWMKDIQDSGIRCILKEENIHFLSGHNADDTLVLTDSRDISRKCAKNGYICIGLDPCMETFFDGAEAVVASITDLDDIYMKETFLRAKGFSVIIAETGRLRIREIIKEDIPALYEISRQDGMDYAFIDQEQAECFECERMEAYISKVYRFWGYGLWTVETLQGEIIGCCGLSDLLVNDNKNAADKKEVLVLYNRYFDETQKCLVKNNLMLELQYFVANRFQNQGYGMEMCSAIMKYAQKRLSEYEICVRVCPENTASVRLAEKLGFIYQM